MPPFQYLAEILGSDYFPIVMYKVYVHAEDNLEQVKFLEFAKLITDRKNYYSKERSRSLWLRLYRYNVKLFKYHPRAIIMRSKIMKTKCYLGMLKAHHKYCRNIL